MSDTMDLRRVFQQARNERGRRSLPCVRPVATILGAVLLVALAGCRSQDGSLPTVFGAVFGLENAPSVPYKVGRIADPAVQPGDKVVGDAANNPGQCIFQRPSGTRFRANCPQGFAIGDAS